MSICLETNTKKVIEPEISKDEKGLPQAEVCAEWTLVEDLRGELGKRLEEWQEGVAGAITNKKADVKDAVREGVSNALIERRMAKLGDFQNKLQAFVEDFVTELRTEFAGKEPGVIAARIMEKIQELDNGATGTQENDKDTAGSGGSNSKNYMSALISAMSALGEVYSETLEGSSERTITLAGIADLSIESSKTRLANFNAELKTYYAEMARAAEAQANASKWGLAGAIITMCIGAYLMLKGNYAAGIMAVTTGAVMMGMQLGNVDAETQKHVMYALTMATAGLSMASGDVWVGAVMGMVATTMYVAEDKVAEWTMALADAMGGEAWAQMVAGAIILIITIAVEAAICKGGSMVAKRFGSISDVATSGASQVARGSQHASEGAQLAGSSRTSSRGLSLAKEGGEDIVKGTDRAIEHTETLIEKLKAKVDKLTREMAEEVDSTNWDRVDNLDDLKLKQSNLEKTVEDLKTSRKASNDAWNDVKNYNELDPYNSAKDVAGRMDAAAKNSEQALTKAQAVWEKAGVEGSSWTEFCKGVKNIPSHLSGHGLRDTSFMRWADRVRFLDMLQFAEAGAMIGQGVCMIQKGDHDWLAGDAIVRQGEESAVLKLLDSIRELAESQQRSEDSFLGQMQSDYDRIIQNAGRTAAGPSRALAHALLAG